LRYARDFLPAEDTGFGSHSAHRGQRQEHLAGSFEDGIGSESDLCAQGIEDGGTAVVGQQIAGVLPDHQLEGSARRRQFRGSVMLLQAGDELREIRHLADRAHRARRFPGYAIITLMGRSPDKPTWVMERLGKVSESNRKFDIEFWQRQGSTAIFAAAWEMVVEAQQWKKKSESELEFQRSVECIKRLRG
jgi:hypothetical protein